MSQEFCYVSGNQMDYDVDTPALTEWCDAAKLSPQHTEFG
jgi:hypothetical protein